MDNTIPIWARVAGVAVFAAVGFYLVGIAVGRAPLLGGELHAPAWVVGSAGVTFLLSGIYLALDAAPTRFSTLRHLVVIAFLTSLAAIFLWIAFGEGAREFTSGSATATLQGNAPKGQGRLAFGTLAMLSCVLIAVECWRAWRNLRRRHEE